MKNRSKPISSDSAGSPAHEATDEKVAEWLQKNPALMRLKSIFSSRKGVIYSAFLILVMVTAIWFSYQHCLKASFQLDDGLRITRNPHIHMRDFSWDHLFSIGQEQHDQRRWFTVFTLKLNYYFSWLKPYGYRLTNVVIHMLASVLLFLIINHTLARARSNLPGDDRTAPVFFTTTAFFCAMAWALSPLNTAAVTYVIQRSVSMSAMLCLAVMGCYLLGRSRKGLKRRLLYALGVILWILAIGSKEPAVLLPLGILLYDLYFFRDLRWSSAKKKQKQITIALFILTGIGMIIVVWPWESLLEMAGKTYNRYDYDHFQRLLSFPRILFYYLGLIFWPLPGRIAVDPSFVAHSRDWLDPWTTIPAWIGLGCLLYGAWGLRRKEKLISFGICWLLLNLLIEQLLIPLQLVFHHRLYLPSMFIQAGVIFFLARQVKAFHTTGPALVIATCAVTMLGFGTYHRNDLWNEPVRIWEAESRLDPKSDRILINLSREYLRLNQPQKAVSVLNRAIDINPQHMGAYINLAAAYQALGKPDQASFFLDEGVRQRRHWPKPEALQHTLLKAENYQAKKDYAKAEEIYQTALGIATSEQTAGIHLRLARLYLQMNENEKAIEEAKNAVQKKEKFYDAYFLLGSMYAVQEKYQEARQAFNAALGGESEINANVYRHLANLAEFENDPDTALELYKKTLEITPNDAIVLLSVAAIQARRNNLSSAQEYYQKVIDTGDMRFMHLAYYNLGRLFLEQGQGQEAFKYMERAYHLNQTHSPTLYALGNLYLDAEMADRGSRLLNQWLKMAPGHPQAPLVRQRLRTMKDDN